MTDELPVHVSREDLHALEVAPSIEVSGPFDVRLVNYGQSVHLHLHMDDTLSEVATLEANNHYVEGNSERSVRVDVRSDRIASDGLVGKLKIVSAYGATTRWIDIELSQPDEDSEPVQVDESLAEPQSDPQPSDSRGPELLVLGLAGLAILIAAIGALIVQNVPVLVGSLVVLGGVVAALYFLAAER